MSPQVLPRDAVVGDAPPAPPDQRGVAFELMFEMVEMLVSKCGSVCHELVGFEAHGGGLLPGRALGVDAELAASGTAPLIREMLVRWPVVVHVFPGTTEPHGAPAARSGTPREAVVIVVHTRDGASLATCGIDRSGCRESSEIDPFGLRGRIAARIEKGRLLPMATH